MSKRKVEGESVNRFSITKLRDVAFKARKRMRSMPPWERATLDLVYRRIELPKDGETRGCDCDTPTTVHDVACPMKGGEL